MELENVKEDDKLLHDKTTPSPKMIDEPKTNSITHKVLDMMKKRYHAPRWLSKDIEGQHRSPIHKKPITRKPYLLLIMRCQNKLLAISSSTCPSRTHFGDSHFPNLNY